MRISPSAILAAVRPVIRRLPPSQRCGSIFLILSLLVLIPPAPDARSATFIWDTAPGVVGPGNGGVTAESGAWNTTNGNWTVDGGANNVAWINATNNDALFQGGTATVTLTTPITAQTVTFSNANHVLTGSPLTLDGAMPTIAVSASSTAVISAQLSATGFSKVGTGWLVLAASNDISGTVTVESSSLAVSHPDALGSPDGPTVLRGSFTSIELLDNVAFGKEPLHMINRSRINAYGSNAWLGPIVANAPATFRATTGSLTLGAISGAGSGSGYRLQFDCDGDVTVTGGISALGASVEKPAISTTGAGTLTLRGTNSYRGNTQVDAGTLVLDEGAQLHFHTGGTNGKGHNVLTGTGKAVLRGAFVIDASASLTNLAWGQWYIVTMPTSAVTYAPTFHIPGWTRSVTGAWLHSTNGKRLTFYPTSSSDEAGLLQQTKHHPVDEWLTGQFGYFVGEGRGSERGNLYTDPDHDGVLNCLEWMLNGDPSSPDGSSILPQISATDTAYECSFRRRPASTADDQFFEYSLDLRTWSSLTIPAEHGVFSVGPATMTITDDAGVDHVNISLPRSSLPSDRVFSRLKWQLRP